MLRDGPPPSSGEGALVRAMGTLGLAAGIVNVTIGGGIFRLPSGVAAVLGAAAPLAYVVCAMAMALIVVCFAEAGSRVSLTGGLYAYVEVAFGPFVGFVSGVLLWAGITAALSAVTSFFADSVAALQPSLTGAPGRTAIILALLAALTALNVRGVRGASRFNTLMTVAKLLPLLLLVAIGAFLVRAENLRWAHAPASGDVARASMFLIFAFLGIESALVPSGEVRDPARTVPRAIFLAMGSIAVIYIAVQLVAQGVLGARLATQQTPLAAAAAVVLGPWGRTLILVGSSLSMFGYVSGMTLAVPRMLFAFARDGFLPARLAAVHPRFRTPHWAIVAQSVIVAALALSGSFERLALVANGAVLLVYAACCLAAVELRRRNVRAGGVPFHLPGAVAAPWLALAVIVWMLASLQRQEWIAVLAVAAAAVPVYLGTHGRTRWRPAPARD